MSEETQSGKMWSGRFREPLDTEFEAWQRSIVFDWQLLQQEVAASKAHASAIAAAGIVTAGELTQLRDALDAIGTEHVSKAGAAQVRDHATAEDIHHYVELALTEKLGPLALRLHTGRSRNEQIATDLRLYVREQAKLTIVALAEWCLALVGRARRAGDGVMPSYTHMQRAEPVLVAHWLLAYVEMLLRDVSRLENCIARLNYCPLGSGAVAGATLKLDRSIAARELGFSAPTANSMDATSDRDFVLEYLQALTFVGLHASRFAEEITLFATAEFGFVQLPEAFSTGSSAMPQKKNPDLTELVRAKVGRIYGAAAAVTLQLKGLPLAYNKDMQETQEPAFSAGFVPQTIALVARFTAALQFNRERMGQAARRWHHEPGRKDKGIKFKHVEPRQIGIAQPAGHQRRTQHDQRGVGRRDNRIALADFARAARIVDPAPAKTGVQRRQCQRREWGQGRIHAPGVAGARAKVNAATHAVRVLATAQA